VVTWIGLAEPTPVTYFPSLIEILITVGMIAGGFLVYGIVVRYFKMFPTREEAHA
jgi:Ni/Fe-hydrogenase subunit HybB-like protein